MFEKQTQDVSGGSTAVQAAGAVTIVQNAADIAALRAAVREVANKVNLIITH